MKKLLLLLLLPVFAYSQMEQILSRPIFLHDGTEAMLISSDLPYGTMIQTGVIIDRINAPDDMSAINDYNFYRDESYFNWNSLFSNEIGKGVIKTRNGQYYLINLYGDNY